MTALTLPPLESLRINERDHITVTCVAAFCATKHAVRFLSERQHQEVKDYNVRVIAISPSGMATELNRRISEPLLAEQIRDFVKDIALPASTMADMLCFTISQPEKLDVNEILFRRTVQPV